MKETLESIKAERDRYLAGLQDIADYCCYPEGKKQAAKVLDLSVPLVRAVPRR